MTDMSCWACRRPATSERWHASGSRSTQRRAVAESPQEFRHERAEIERFEDFTGVTLGVLGHERDAVAVAYALSVVLAVLELAQLGRRC